MKRLIRANDNQYAEKVRLLEFELREHGWKVQTNGIYYINPKVFPLSAVMVSNETGKIEVFDWDGASYHGSRNESYDSVDEMEAGINSRREDWWKDFKWHKPDTREKGLK